MKKIWAFFMTLFFVISSHAAVNTAECTGSYNVGSTLNVSLEYPVVSQCFPMDIEQYSKIEFKSTWSGEQTVTGRILYKNGEMLGYATDNIHYLSPGKYYVYVESFLSSATNNDQSSISLRKRKEKGDSCHLKAPLFSSTNLKEFKKIYALST